MRWYDKRGVSVVCGTEKEEGSGGHIFIICGLRSCVKQREERGDSVSAAFSGNHLESSWKPFVWKSGAKSLGTDDLNKSPGVVWKSVLSLMSAFVKPTFFLLNCAAAPTSKLLVSPGILQPGSHNAANNNTTSCFVPLLEEEPF